MRLALQGQLDEPTTIAQDTIDTLPLGPEIGILQGPETLPGSDEMVESGWTACTGPAKALQVDVSARPDATPIGDGQAFVVKSEGEVWVVATAPATVDRAARNQPQALAPPPGLFPGAEWQAPNKAAPGFEWPQKSLARGHHLRWRHAHAFLAPPAPAPRGVKAGWDSEELPPALGADQCAALECINHLWDFGEYQPGGTE